ncbi:MAG: hypothetical protein AAB465_01090 [Patescibacteria group bacterium]
MKKILSYLLVVVLILVIIYFGFVIVKKVVSAPTYQAVKLASGEVYFGKLHLFPRLKMTDAHYVQYTPAKEGDTTATPENQLLPLSAMAFQPTNTLYLLKEQISWWTDLSPDSQIVKLMKQEKETK